MANVEAASARMGVLMPTAKKIAKNQRGKRYDHYEFERLSIQLRHARIFARLVQSALGDHSPIQIRNRGVSADHFGFLSVIRGFKAP